MAIGVVNDRDFEGELSDLSILDKPKIEGIPEDEDTLNIIPLNVPYGGQSRAKIVDLNKGRGIGDKAVPMPLRKLIGSTAIAEGNKEAKELAEEFDISDSSVSAYKKGATSTATYHEPNQELVKHTNSARTKISEAAQKILLASIDSITPEKLAAAKLREVAGVARDMSAVVKNIEPSSEEASSNVQFVLFAPRVKEEKEYEVIDVSE